MAANYEIGKRLKLLMRLNSYTISQLSEISGVSEDTIKSIRSGKTTNPSINVLAALADAFSCTLDNLIGRFPKSLDESELLRKWRSLDNHGRSAVKLLIDSELTSLPAHSSKTRPLMFYSPNKYTGNGAMFDMSRPEYLDIPADYMKNADFGIKIVSDSYIPDYYPEDIVALVKRTALNGEIGFYSDGTTIYIRKCVYINGIKRLIPLYPAHNEIELKNTNDYTCIGTVIGVIRLAR